LFIIIKAAGGFEAYFGFVNMLKFWESMEYIASTCLLATMNLCMRCDFSVLVMHNAIVYAIRPFNCLCRSAAVVCLTWISF